MCRSIAALFAGVVAVPAAALAVASAPGPYVRTCDSAVYGELNADWQKNAVVVGSITLIGVGGQQAVRRLVSFGAGNCRGSGAG